MRFLATLAMFCCIAPLHAVADEPTSSRASGPAGLPASSAVRFASSDTPAEPIVATPEPPSTNRVEPPEMPEFKPIAPAPQQIEEPPAASLNAWERLASLPADLPPASPASALDETPLDRPRTFPVEDGAADARRLLRAKSAPAPGAAKPSAKFGFESFNLPPEALATTGAALGVVVGVLLLSVWCLRKAAPRGCRPLPNDVVMLLGQVRLSGKQTAQLMKIGSKLVLVSVTPEGAKPITEITDPDEVSRVLGMCEQANPNGATAAFQEIFEQLTREPAHGGLVGDEPSLLDRRRLADAYANTPGGRAYG